MNEPGLERPDGYSDEEWAAYQEGAQQMLELAGSFLLSMAGNVDGGSDPRRPVGDGDDGDDVGEDGDDDYPDTCECGRELVYEMGDEEGKCPNCDLL